MAFRKKIRRKAHERDIPGWTTARRCEDCGVEINVLGRAADGTLHPGKACQEKEEPPYVAPEDQPVDEYTGTVEVCCHTVDFSYHGFDPCVLSEEDRERLTEAAEERAKQCIVEGCHQGELCHAVGLGEETVEFRGWFWIRGTWKGQ